jgi:AcrR family transcriptional regulator
MMNRFDTTAAETADAAHSPDTEEQNDGVSDAKQRVLDCAEGLFMRLGYNAVTLRDIADALGIRQASLYYHFPQGKEQLYINVAERAFLRHRAGMEAALAAVGPDLATQLQAVADWFDTQPKISFSGMMHADMPALADESADYLARTAYECLFIPLGGIFRDAGAHNRIRAVNPDMMAGTYLAILDGVVYSGTRPGTPERRAMLKELISVLIDGLRPRADSAADHLQQVKQEES